MGRSVEVIDFTMVKVNIPKKMLVKVFDEHKTIDQKTYMKISRKSDQIEKAILKLQKAYSVVEKIKERWIPGCPMSGVKSINSHTL
jgi:hypothetical protein